MDSSLLIYPIGRLYAAATDASQDGGSKENPENNPDCTTVYVGNIGHEVETKCCKASFCSPFLLFYRAYPFLGSYRTCLLQLPKRK
jgi:hypothetical protein